jgi:GST-like protein
LAEKTGKLLGATLRERTAAIQWLTWQMAGLGPMGGQASHFLRYAPPGQDYAIKRYTRELDRLLHVLERRLSQAPYLAGDSYSIADIAIWPGRRASLVTGTDVSQWPATKAWFDRIAERPAVQRAMTRPDLVAPPKYLRPKQVLSNSEWSNMFGDAMHAAVRQPRN